MIKTLRIAPVLSRLLMVAAIAAPALASAQALLPSAGPTPEQIATIESVPQLLAIAAESQRRNDLTKLALALERVATIRPLALPYRYELAAAYAQQGDKTRAYDRLLNLQTLGFAGAPEDDPRFVRVHGTEAWDYIVANLKANRSPFGEGKVAYTLPAGDTGVEAIAWDPDAKTLLVGSMREGSIQRLGANGKLKKFIEADRKNGLWSVLDLAVDAKNDVLWVASTALPHFKRLDKADLGRAALFKFELDSGKFLARYDAPKTPAGQILTALAVTPSGEPYAVNGATRQIFRVKGTALEMVVANPRLQSIRGITISGDGKTLYLADYEQGIFGLDLDKGQGFAVAVLPKVSLYGIEGMYWYENNLVIVQNGFPPNRVMRVTLDPTGRRVVRAQALEAAKPDMTLPTRGTLAGSDFYFIANSQKTQYDGYGKPLDGAKLEGVKLYKTNARFVWDAPTTPQRPMFVPRPATGRPGQQAPGQQVPGQDPPGVDEPPGAAPAQDPPGG